jgi:peroxiredoxin
MRSDMAPGGVFPDYELRDHTGSLCELSELHGDDLLVLTLARGRYCPKEPGQAEGSARRSSSLAVPHRRMPYL